MMNTGSKNWRDIYKYYYKRGISGYVVDSLSKILISFLLSLAPIIFFGCIQSSKISDRSGPNVEYHFIFSFSNGWRGIDIFWKMAVVSFFTFTLYKIVKFAITVQQFRKLHRYFVDTLGISDDELGKMKWALIVESISVNDPILDAPKLTIAQTILRKENYITGIMSDQSLLTWKMPPSAERVSPIPMSIWFCRLFITSLTGVLIDRNGCSIVSIQPLTQTPRMLSNLKLRFRIIGISLFFLIPFSFAFETMYLVYYYLNRFRKMWAKFSFREWTPHYKWILREYNELPHQFKARMDESYDWANKYLGVSPLPFVKPLAKVLEFASAFFIVVVCVMCLVTDVTFILNTSVMGKSIAWFTIITLILFSVAHSVAHSGAYDTNADMAVSEIERISHYDFRDESHSAQSSHTRDKVSKAFPDMFVEIAREMFSVVLNPFLFLVFLPERASSLIEFMRKNSADKGEVGWICAFSTFDVGDRGFAGSADQREKVLRSIRYFEGQTDAPQVIPDSHLIESGIHSVGGGELGGGLLPRATSPLVRTDFGGSNEALSNLEDFIPNDSRTDFFSYPAEFEQDI